MGLALRDRTGGCDNRTTADSKTWVDREVARCDFRDARLGKRFRTLLERIGSDIGQSIPFVCQDWANTKAAYRFSPMIGSAKRTFYLVISNRRVSAWLQRTVLFSCYTTRPSLPIKGIGRS
jgi:hypothetical protein